MSASAGARARMVVLSGQYQGHAFDLTGAVTIGRSAECEIVFDLPSVSRQHARVEPRGEGFVALDLGSRNGIKVGGVAVHESPLNDGDVLTVGDVQLRFEAVKGPPPPPAATTAGGLSAPARPATASVKHLKFKLLIAVAIGLVTALVLGFFLLKILYDAPQTRVANLRPMVLRVGENKWMRVSGWRQLRIGNSRDWTWVRLGDFADVSVQAPPAGAPSAPATPTEPIVAVQRYDPGEVVVTGKSGGDTTVTFLMNSGAVLHMRVLVRGRLEDPVEELRNLDLGEEGRRLRAIQYVEAGKGIQADRPYLALQEYRKALVVLEKVRDKGAVFLEARTRAQKAEADVNRRWEELRTAVSVAATSNDRTRQMQLLEEATKLIPDPNDPRYQKAQGRLQQLIEEEIKARQDRSGRR